MGGLLLANFCCPGKLNLFSHPGKVWKKVLASEARWEPKGGMQLETTKCNELWSKINCNCDLSRKLPWVSASPGEGLRRLSLAAEIWHEPGKMFDKHFCLFNSDDWWSPSTCRKCRESRGDLGWSGYCWRSRGLSPAALAEITTWLHCRHIIDYDQLQDLSFAFQWFSSVL